MSGIYLTVWDDVKEFDRVLNPTKGGWPHVTLAWTGKKVSHRELKSVAKEVIDYWLMEPLTLTKARVNTFFHEGEGKERHDVLLLVEETEKISLFRAAHIVKRFPDRQKHFNMMEPHVTIGWCWSKEGAQAEVDRINELLPIQVTVTGVTI